MANLKVFLLVLASMLCASVSSVSAEMSSVNYQITLSVISGGGNSMSSTNDAPASTFGQSSPLGNTSSNKYHIGSGFWRIMLLDKVGDINGDGAVNLRDVIEALNVVTGTSVNTIIKEADIDGDGKIGLCEALCILRNLSYL